MKIGRGCYNDTILWGHIEGERFLSLKKSPFEGIEYDGNEYPLNAIKLLAPTEPSKIACVGKNYYEHSMEIGEGHPEVPILFIKPSTCVIGMNDKIIYPDISNRVDYEAELAIVIGKRAKNVDTASASDYIFGYTCLNDVTARDIQKSDKQWTRGKSFDTFCPIGPWIETEFDMKEGVSVISRLNGEIRQNGNTKLMTYNVSEIISYITSCMTLLPGDVVATGTPVGIGSMQKGDIIEIEITGIGTLRNVIA